MRISQDISSSIQEVRLYEQMLAVLQQQKRVDAKINDGEVRVKVEAKKSP
jgi:hypothetical protein